MFQLTIRYTVQYNQLQEGETFKLSAKRLCCKKIGGEKLFNNQLIGEAIKYNCSIIVKVLYNQYCKAPIKKTLKFQNRILVCIFSNFN